ncbi:MAG: transcriptional repressor [Paludibacteraceae bacterium]|nr:transcriptional repressor [Paludibacteraceae bacterium]
MNAYEHLLKHGIKPSSQRIIIMDYLLTHRTHPTSDEIYNALKVQNPTLSKTTVYNTLRLLEEKGAALNLSIDEKNARYDGDTTDHAHFICTCCGKIIDMGIITPPEVSNEIGCEIKQMQVYIKGICKDCKKTIN